MTIRVLLVDDEELVARYLASILAHADDIIVIGTEHDGAAAVDATVRLRPDVVLMDLRMPGVNGIRATERIRALHLPTKVIALTVFDTDASVLAALRAGADSFLLKATPPHDLINVIRVVAQGQTVLSPSVAARLVAVGITEAEATQQARTRLHDLTARERQVLLLISRGRTNAEIGADLNLAEATIKGYVSQVLVKLGCENRTQAGLLAQAARMDPNSDGL